MTHLTEQIGPCKARDSAKVEVDREFVIAAVRTARSRLQLMVCELDEIGVALKFEMLPLESAVLWLHEVDALGIVNPDVWRESQPVSA